MIYLDNNATTRVFEEVADAMRPYLVDRFANPASAIGEFDGVGRAIAESKTSVARLLGAAEGGAIVVTSGATEANNHAILGAARACPSRRHLIVSSVEHPSVLETVRHLETSGYRVTLLPVSRAGAVAVNQVHQMLSPDTLLVSVMLANNETGVIQPVGEIADVVKNYDPHVLVHTDATQAIGKLPVDLGGGLAAVDLLSFSAHKFHGPKGVGALFVRESVPFAPLLFGGGQQGGLRPGTENPSAVIGMAKAMEYMAARKQSVGAMQSLRDRIESEVKMFVPGSLVLGAEVPRLPNTLNLFLPGVQSTELVDKLASCGIAISSGSACSHGALRPSHVLLAMGLGHTDAQCCIRISLSIETTRSEVESFLIELGKACPRNEAAGIAI
ncbi:cysteine desulfurase NifS [mine drainage metagenome]|uniref:cysteine desulfurase n=1 Tax=mine drainage metagenome TaxID=410659 RepID=A0A1J5T5H5_9ZZZZ